MKIVFETLVSAHYDKSDPEFRYIATYTEDMTEQLMQRMLDYPDHYFYAVDIAPDTLKQIRLDIVERGDYINE